MRAKRGEGLKLHKDTTAIIKKALNDKKISISSLAKLRGVSRKVMSDGINGQATVSFLTQKVISTVLEIDDLKTLNDEANK